MARNEKCKEVAKHSVGKQHTLCIQNPANECPLEDARYIYCHHPTQPATCSITKKKHNHRKGGEARPSRPPNIAGGGRQKDQSHVAGVVVVVVSVSIFLCVYVCALKRTHFKSILTAR